MLPNKEVLKQNPGLFEYQVSLIEKDGTEEIVFDCFAEDAVHAMEQAENAYPGCEEMMTTRNCSYAIIPHTKH